MGDLVRSVNSAVMFICTYKQNDSISLHLSDFVKCRRGYYFRAWVLSFSFGTYWDVNIKQFINMAILG